MSWSPVVFIMYVHSFDQACQCTVVRQGYHGAAAGKGRQLAKTELEKLKLSEMTTREAVIEAARMWVGRLLLATILDLCLPEYMRSMKMPRRRTLSWRCRGSEMRPTGCMFLFPVIY